LISSTAPVTPPRWWPNSEKVTASKMADLPEPLSPLSIHSVALPPKSMVCSSR
jgi:hypothetical protein